MAEQSVSLAPGESKVVAFEVSPTEARAYQVSVNGLSGSFVALEVPEIKLVYVSDIRHHREKTPCGATYTIFEVDVQNQGNVSGPCSCIARRRVLTRDGWSGWMNFNYDPYCGSEALVWKIDHAVIKPGETVTFSEGLEKWPYLYEPSWDILRLEVRFKGDAGEILTGSMRPRDL